MNNKGFTLIEVLVVVVTTGLIMAIAINRFSRISQATDINDDMHKISTFLKSKRLTAFTIKEEISIRVEAGGKTITATIDPGGTPVGDGSIALKYPVAPVSTTYTINRRGLYSTPGNIHLAAVNDSTPNSCVVIDAQRVRIGGWDGTNCDAR